MYVYMFCVFSIVSLFLFLLYSFYTLSSLQLQYVRIVTTVNKYNILIIRTQVVVPIRTMNVFRGEFHLVVFFSVSIYNNITMCVRLLQARQYVHIIYICIVYTVQVYRGKCPTLVGDFKKFHRTCVRAACNIDSFNVLISKNKDLHFFFFPFICQ